MCNSRGPVGRLPVEASIAASRNSVATIDPMVTPNHCDPIESIRTYTTAPSIAGAAYMSSGPITIGTSRATMSRMMVPAIADTMPSTAAAK